MDATKRRPGRPPATVKLVTVKFKLPEELAKMDAEMKTRLGFRTISAMYRHGRDLVYRYYNDSKRLDDDSSEDFGDALKDSLDDPMDGGYD